MKGSKRLVVGTLALPLAGGAALGQTWNEVGDAGDLPASAQVPLGVGSLDMINGFIFGLYDVDMYMIQINDPATFGAETVTNGTFFDTKLWLFDMHGNGVVFNNDSSSPPSINSAIGPAYVGMSPLGTPTPVYPGPGIYYLAISSGLDAVSTAGLIWNSAPLDTQRGPNGLGAPGPITGWIGSNWAHQWGSYHIRLSGAKFIPAPGSLALLGLGALAARRRRR